MEPVWCFNDQAQVSPRTEKQKKNRMDTLEKQLGFIREAEGLKSVVREAWASTGRRESTAEHS